MPRRAVSKETSHQDLYETALTKAERTRLSHVRTIDGLDQEIAFLRLRLERLAKNEPDRIEVLLKGMNVLVRLVATRYKLSPVAKDNLSHSLAKVIDEIGGALLPEGFGSDGV